MMKKIIVVTTAVLLQARTAIFQRERPVARAPATTVARQPSAAESVGEAMPANMLPMTTMKIRTTAPRL